MYEAVLHFHNDNISIT